MENAEISAIVNILGLKFGESYNSEESRKKLRYGSVMIMTDQVNLCIIKLYFFWKQFQKKARFASFASRFFCGGSSVLGSRWFSHQRIADKFLTFFLAVAVRS